MFRRIALLVLAASLAANAWLLYRRESTTPPETPRAIMMYNGSFSAIWAAVRGLQSATEAADPVLQRQAPMHASWWLHEAHGRLTYFGEMPSPGWKHPYSGPLVPDMRNRLFQTWLKVDELLVKNLDVELIPAAVIAELNQVSKVIEAAVLQVQTEDELKRALSTRLED